MTSGTPPSRRLCIRQVTPLHVCGFSVCWRCSSTLPAASCCCCCCCRYYRALYSKQIGHLLQGVAAKNLPGMRNLAMELRKLCCHPVRALLNKRQQTRAQLSYIIHLIALHARGVVRHLAAVDQWEWLCCPATPAILDCRVAASVC